MGQGRKPFLEVGWEVAVLWLCLLQEEALQSQAACFAWRYGFLPDLLPEGSSPSSAPMLQKGKIHNVSVIS